MPRLDPSIPAGAFSDDDQSRMPNYGQMALQRGVIEDRDKERQNQAEIERIAKASGGDYEQMILAMRARGMHKEADAYEVEKVNTRVKNSKLLDDTLARESKIVGQGASYASSVLEIPDVDPATMTIPQMTAHMAQIKAAYGRAKGMTAALGRPEVAEEVYGEFDPMTWRTRMQQAVTMGTNIVELNSVKREALEYIRDGKWEPGLQRWLSTVQSKDPKMAQEEWDRILATAKSQGMPKSVLDRFPKQWSEAAVQQMKDLQLTEQQKQANKIADTRAQADLKTAEARLIAAGPDAAPTGLSAVDARAKRNAKIAATTWRNNKELEIHEDPDLTDDEREAKLGQIGVLFDRQIKQIDEQYPETAPPPRGGTGGGTTIGDMGVEEVPLPVGPPPLFGPGSAPRIDAPPRRTGTATAPPTTSVSEMGGVAAAAGTNPNSPAVPPPAPTSTPSPAAAPPAPTQAQPGARPGWNAQAWPNTGAPANTGWMQQGLPSRGAVGAPAPMQPDIALPREDASKSKLPSLNMSSKTDWPKIVQRAIEAIRALPPKPNGERYEATEDNIRLFLSKEKNRRAYNIVEK